jgi:predicted lipoprotein with Yx(FWY)xxD motif
MRTMRFLLVPLAVGLVLAACGSNDTKSSTSATTAQAQTSTSSAANAVTVKISKTNLGDVLADSQGRTLYALSTESATKITCVDNCAAKWPPLVVPAGQTPKAEAGVGALTVANRPDGSRQVVSDNKPLYTFAGDAKAGDTLGEGVGGVWHVVKPASTASGSGSGAAGQTATTAAAVTTTPTTKPAGTPQY